MQVLDFLKNLDREVVILVLILFVLLLQVIHIFLLKRIRKSAGAKPVEDLKPFITNEINRLKEEMIAFETKVISGLKKEPERLIQTEMIEKKKESPGLELEQVEEMEPSPETMPEPDETGFTQIGKQEDTEIKPLPEEMEFEIPQTTLGSGDIQGCLDEYNEAITDEGRQYQFLDKYQPIRVDVTNALERRRRADKTPVYQTADNGDYCVVELEDMGRTVYAVLPRFDLIIKNSNYQAGAFGEVFDCPDYRENYRYLITRVVKPAVFEKGRNEFWEILSKGRIMLSSE